MLILVPERWSDHGHVFDDAEQLLGGEALFLSPSHQLRADGQGP